MPPSEGLEQTTVYVKNLNDKISSISIRKQLYLLFSPFGVILDIVALKTTKMRGQAFIVYRERHALVRALDEMRGVELFGKPMHLEEAKTISKAYLQHMGRLELPTEEGSGATNEGAVLPARPPTE